MKILTIGDVVARQGCDCLRHILPGLKRELGANLTIVNGENSAVGNGILPGSAQFIFDSGADVITLGNHGLRRREIYPMLEENEFLLRPAACCPTYCKMVSLVDPEVHFTWLSMTNELFVLRD